MRIQIDKLFENTNKLVIFIFVFLSLLMPNDPFNLIKLCFLVIVGLNIDVIFFKLVEFKEKTLFFYGFVFPLILFLFSIISGNNFYNSIAGTYFFFFLLLIFPIIKYKINFTKVLLINLAFISFMTVMFAILDFIDILSIFNNPIIKYLYLNGNISIGKGAQFPLNYSLRFNSSPILVFAIGYALFKRNYIYIILFFAASIISGTRINIFAPFIVLFLFILFIYNNKNKYRYLIICFMMLALILIIYMLFPYIHDMFVRKETSDAVRNLDYLSYLKIFRDVDVFLFGQGFAATFFSYGRSNFTTSAEMGYWEFIRQFGFINFIAFIVFLILPIKDLWKDISTRWLGVSYLVYLLASYHNPNLYTSLSFLVYILLYYSLLNNEIYDINYKTDI